MNRSQAIRRYTPGIGEQSQILEEHLRDLSKNVTHGEIAGFPWQFVLVMAVIALGVLGIALKVAGLF